MSIWKDYEIIWTDRVERFRGNSLYRAKLWFIHGGMYPLYFSGLAAYAGHLLAPAARSSQTTALWIGLPAAIGFAIGTSMVEKPSSIGNLRYNVWAFSGGKRVQL